MNTILKLVAILIGLAILGNLIAGQRNSTSISGAVNNQANNNESLQKSDLAKMVSDMNKGLPRMIGQGTLMAKVEVSEKSLNYFLKYTEFGSRNIDPSLLRDTENILGDKQCKSDNMKWLRSQGLFTRYIVTASDDVKVSDFSITTAYCSHLGL